jgi:hypothetical protein
VARALTAVSSREQLVREYVNELVQGSLQSTEELARAVSALGIDPVSVGAKGNELQPIFRIRNQIIHELDINFDHPKRNRQTCARETMRQHTNKILEVSEAILRQVDAKSASLEA